jgi:hypothetical protein
MIKWIYDFCQDYSIGNFNVSGEDQKPTIALFLYNLYRKLRGWTPIYRLRMLFQFLFRPSHIPDCDLWEASSAMAQRILPVLHAFKKMKRNGFPSTYSEYDENSGWKSKELYDDAIKEGIIIGGGEKRWEADLDHMIHAIEYVAWESSKKITKWYINNFGMDPYADDIRNKYKYYTYKEENGLTGMTFGDKPTREVTDLKEHESYGNHELLQYIDEYVNSGLEKLGKMWRALWD